MNIQRANGDIRRCQKGHLCDKNIESYGDMFNYKLCCSLGRFILLGRLSVLLLTILSVGTSPLSAQVVECPGFLPSFHVADDKKLAMARRLLSRFISVLDLRGIDAINERLIMTMYNDHPEQLAIKLSYLGLQCQMRCFGVRDDEAQASGSRQARLFGLYPSAA